MSSVFVTRYLEHHLPVRGDFRRPTTTPHVTLAFADNCGNDLAQLAHIIRDAPDSAANDLVVYPEKIIQVGRKRTMASLAIHLAQNDQLREEIAHYRSSLGIPDSFTPHITLAQHIPYEDIESEQGNLEAQLHRWTDIRLKPVTVRVQTDPAPRAPVGPDRRAC